MASVKSGIGVVRRSSRLAREITLVLLAKVLLLSLIWLFWFSHPPRPEQGAALTGVHLFGAAAAAPGIPTAREP